MTCKHDPLYQIENEANGGAGCPICNAQPTTDFCHGCGSSIHDHDWALCYAEAQEREADARAEREDGRGWLGAR